MSTSSRSTPPQELPSPYSYPGILSLVQACGKVYPDQRDLTTTLEYRPDDPETPLNYINIYEGPGVVYKTERAHWHYVGFGLTDLHGDGRIWPIKTDPTVGPSGFGFELTFRVKREGQSFPSWPAKLLQHIATYIIQSGRAFVHGDHISMFENQSISGPNSKSRIKHMLVAPDTTLEGFHGPNGSVQFLQLVGITSNELRAVHDWDGISMIEMLKQSVRCGGHLLITDINRSRSIFTLAPSTEKIVKDAVDRNGSSFSNAFASNVIWIDDLFAKVYTNDENQIRFRSSRISALPIKLIRRPPEKLPKVYPGTSELETKKQARKEKQQQAKEHRQAHSSREMDAAASLLGLSKPASPTPVYEIVETLDDSDPEEAEDGVDLDNEVQVYDFIHISLNSEPALLLPKVLRNRVRFSQEFSFISTTNENKITFAHPGMDGVFVSTKYPFATKKNWLQIYMEDDLIRQLLDKMNAIDFKRVKYPVTILCARYQFALTITE